MVDKSLAVIGEILDDVAVIGAGCNEDRHSPSIDGVEITELAILRTLFCST